MSQQQKNASTSLQYVYNGNTMHGKLLTVLAKLTIEFCCCTFMPNKLICSFFWFSDLLVFVLNEIPKLSKYRFEQVVDGVVMKWQFAVRRKAPSSWGMIYYFMRKHLLWMWNGSLKGAVLAKEGGISCTNSVEYVKRVLLWLHLRSFTLLANHLYI